MKEIWDEATKIAEKTAIDMLNECDGTYVGAERKEIFELNGNKYEVTTNAFWEKQNHFDCTVKGIDNDFNKFECCIIF